MRILRLQILRPPATTRRSIHPYIACQFMGESEGFLRSCSQRGLNFLQAKAVPLGALWALLRKTTPKMALRAKGEGTDVTLHSADHRKPAPDSFRHTREGVAAESIS